MTIKKLPLFSSWLSDLLCGALFALFWQTRLSIWGNQIVDYLIPFLYLSDFLILIFVAATLVFSPGALLNFSKKPELRRIHFWAAGFLLLALLSNLLNRHSPWAISAFYKLLKLTLFYVFAVSLASLLSFKRRLLPKLLLFFNLGLFLEALIAIGEVLRQSSLGWQILGEWRFSVLTPGIAKVFLGDKLWLRPYATFPHPNVLGGVMALTAVANLFFFLHPPAHHSKRIYLFFWLLFLSVTFLSFSRTAWLACLILMLAVVFTQGTDWFWGQFFRRAFPLLLLGLFFLTPLIWERLKSLQSVDQLSLERRWELVLAALEMAKAHPLLGVGLNQFVPNLEKYILVSGPDRFLQPVHNIYLLVLAEHGVWGLVALSGFILQILRLVFQALGQKLAQLALLMWLGIFLIGLFDHYFWSLQAGQLFFWLVVGLSLSLVD